MTTSAVVPPGLALVAAALLLPWLSGRWRAAVLLMAPLAALWLVWQVPDGVALGLGVLDLDLAPVRGDRLSRLFGTIFTAMAFLGGLFALHQPRPLELAAAYAYAGAAVVVCFAGDLLTLFVGWELMALASTLVVWSAGPEARAAGLRYAIVVRWRPRGRRSSRRWTPARRRGC